MRIVILAGGVGTRLWPLGRKNNPKQFFPIISKKPLVKETYDRFVQAYGAEHIYFSVTAELLKPLRKVFPRVPLEQFIVEPARRDTAAAMGYVSAVLSLHHPDEPMVFVPSDHFVADIKKYLRCFRIGETIVKKTGNLVDIGIAATFPSTVLGYTKIGQLYKKINGVAVYHFAGHTEKPALSVAAQYIESGHYLWHANYYMWTPRKFLEAFEVYAPAYAAVLKAMIPLIKKREARNVAALYERMEKNSFDYAITEKINKKNVYIIKGDFGWSDVGAWDMLHNQLSEYSDKKGNVVRGRVVPMDTDRCLLFTHDKKMIATIGLKDMVVVDTPDALLVCPKDRAQDVKKLFPHIEQEGLHTHL